MIVINLIDHLGDEWELVWQGVVRGGEAWWYAPVRPAALKDYEEVPLPVFTEWF